MLGALLLGLGGCGMTSPKPTYYTLSPLESTTRASHTQATSTLAVGIGPVSFPDELDRPSIVTRSGQSRLVIDEFHRWGGSLKKNFLRVLADNLAHDLQTDQIMVRPWEHYFQPDIRITLDVHQFVGELGKSASLTLVWTVHKTGGESREMVYRNTFTEPVAEPGYDGLVAAQSRLIKQLAKEMASVIAALQAV